MGAVSPLNQKDQSPPASAHHPPLPPVGQLGQDSYCCHRPQLTTFRLMRDGQRCKLRRLHLCSGGLDLRVRCAAVQPRQVAAASAYASPANTVCGPSRVLCPQAKLQPLPPRPAHHAPPHSVQRSRVPQVLWSIACIRCLALPPILLVCLPGPFCTTWPLNPGRRLVQLLPKRKMGSPLSSLVHAKITLDPVT